MPWIDAGALKEKYADQLSVQRVFGYDAGFVAGILAALEMPTLSPPNEPLTCVGCIYEPDCPSEIHCHGCARIFVDHYRRPPEGEA